MEKKKRSIGAEPAKAEPLAPVPPAPIQFIRLPEVSATVGLGRSQIHHLIARGQFPKPVKLGKRASAWISREVQEWMAARIADSRPESRNGR